ncbi:nucleotidyltransferase domain-containing protein [Prosthecodimorpha staleyi]|uniref:Nucleotidyltransferase domain-containing protein n=1 Tax=Prosthecodimorpha staleyi TaxID=2840188 RepID=A0A947GDA9_9HYPH|nr:nucleotidyltransferase domain-containing protein [Prosthecodimorpha staleyi]MBT9290091.1 nucleotidyltransferase domain-containing protein [Prosthecodimorpha staleyi]
MEASFVPYNNDQARMVIDARQRFSALVDARRRRDGYRGSMTWVERGGAEYLIRSLYPEGGSARRQKSLGLRSPETEALKREFEVGRAEAEARVVNLEDGVARMAAVVESLGLGRVPSLSARILRMLDDAGLLGRKLRLVGTNALFAYEAIAAANFDPGLTTTEDMDLLFHAGAGLRFTAQEELSRESLIALLRRVDRSFGRAGATFRAVNRDGFYVDLIKPEPRPPWRPEPEGVSSDVDDLVASGIEGLFWLQNAPTVETVAFDQKGVPVRLVACDPRAFAVHKLWLSGRLYRDPAKRQRDAGQARAVAEIVATRLLHLPFEAEALRMMPRELVEAAAPLFAAHKPPKLEW